MERLVVKIYGEYGCVDKVEYDKLNWTGKWKMETIDGRTRILVQRRMMLFGFIPTFTTWVEDDDFVWQHYDCYQSNCLDLENILEV